MSKSEVAKPLYTDRVCSVILSKYPVEKGHLLVVSKAHYTDMLSAPDGVLAHMFKVTKRFGKITKERTKCVGIDIGVNIGIGSVQHLHIHILPRHSTRMIHFAPGKSEIRKKEANELRRLLKL
jgi:histidine triad (HIT) family protein